MVNQTSTNYLACYPCATACDLKNIFFVMLPVTGHGMDDAVQCVVPGHYIVAGTMWYPWCVAQWHSSLLLCACAHRGVSLVRAPCCAPLEPISQALSTPFSHPDYISSYLRPCPAAINGTSPLHVLLSHHSTISTAYQSQHLSNHICLLGGSLAIHIAHLWDRCLDQLVRVWQV